jgi:biopolymer transport protein ExbD
MRHPITIEHANPLIDMNTTPLIDVLLVLLIMFIITIPIQTHAVKLDLPAACAGCPIVERTANIVTIGSTGQIAWNGRPVSKQDLSFLLRQAQQMPTAPELHLRPDTGARYGMVDQVLAIIKREHVERFGFVDNGSYVGVF